MRFVYTFRVILLDHIRNICDFFGAKRSEFDPQTLHSKCLIAIFLEFEVKKLKYEVPGRFLLH